MNRRRFLNSLVGGVAVAAATRTWPFRVFSFPSRPTAYPALTAASIVNPSLFAVGDIVGVDREVLIVTAIHPFTVRRGV